MLGLMLKPSIAWSTRTTRTTVNGAKVVVFFDKCSLYYCASGRGRLVLDPASTGSGTWGLAQAQLELSEKLGELENPALTPGV